MKTTLNRLKTCFAFSVVLAVLPLVACTDNYKACSQVGQTIATTVTSADNTVLSLAKSGAISTQESIDVLGYLAFANQSDESFLRCAKTAHTNGNVVGSYTACVNAFIGQLNTPSELALIHVSNANSQAQVQTIITGIQSGITLLQSSLGGA
jgi:hypothetical protein